MNPDWLEKLLRVLETADGSVPMNRPDVLPEKRSVGPAQRGNIPVPQSVLDALPNRKTKIDKVIGALADMTPVGGVESIKRAYQLGTGGDQAGATRELINAGLQLAPMLKGGKIAAEAEAEAAPFWHEAHMPSAAADSVALRGVRSEREWAQLNADNNAATSRFKQTAQDIRAFPDDRRRELLDALKNPDRPYTMPSKYAILTGENPGGVEATPERNAEYNRAFEKVLQQQGVKYDKVLGAYPDPTTGASLKENSFLLHDVEPAHAERLGRWARQNGVVSHAGYHNLAEGKLHPTSGMTDAGAGNIYTQLPDGRRVVSNVDWSTSGDLHAPVAAPRGAWEQQPPRTWTPAQLETYGRIHGVPGLGLVGEPHPLTLRDGTVVNIPGGLDGKFSYHDMLTLKAQAINPRNMDEATHVALQKKISRSMAPGEHGDDANTFRGLLFGGTSPNNPLTPNEFAVSRMMPRNMDDVGKLARMAVAPDASKAERQAASKAISHAYGLQAKDKGGLGVSGSADYSRIADMAKMFTDRPDFFRKTEQEPWDQFVQRVATQVPGLSMKTGSFGTVWQDVEHAGISAMDRHMGDVFWNKITADPTKRAAVEKELVDNWNAEAAKDGKDVVTSLDELRGQPGGEGAFKDRVMQMLTAHKSPLFRLKTGEINPAVPDYLQKADWVTEPKHAVLMGDNYRTALDANAEHAAANGLDIFPSQWNLWDRARGRLEPHEVMTPGLNKLPRMSQEDAAAALRAHSEAGYMGNKGTAEGAVGSVRPVANPMDLAYWALVPGAIGAGGLFGNPAPIGATGLFGNRKKGN